MRVWRIENDDSWLLSAALWVFAHTTGTGVTRMRNALMPSWLLGGAMLRSTRSLPPTVSEAMWAAGGVAGPVCRPSTGGRAIGLASGSGEALRNRWPLRSAQSDSCLIQRRIDEVATSVAGL